MGNKCHIWYIIPRCNPWLFTILVKLRVPSWDYFEIMWPTVDNFALWLLFVFCFINKKQCTHLFFNMDTNKNHVTDSLVSRQSWLSAFNVNKAHGQDNISVRMLKICKTDNIKPLKIYLKEGIFSKKVNCSSTALKVGQKIFNNYNPVSLLFIWKKTGWNKLPGLCLSLAD